VRDRYHALIKSTVPSLISAGEQDCRSPWIESIEYPERPAAALYAQLAHTGVSRSRDSRRIGEGELRPLLHQEQYRGCHVFLLRVPKVLPPFPEFVCMLNVPSHHPDDIPLAEYIAREKWMSGSLREVARHDALFGRAFPDDRAPRP